MATSFTLPSRFQFLSIAPSSNLSSYFQVNSVFHNPALPSRNWFSADVTLSRLRLSLGVLASGHLNSTSKSGTYPRQGGRCAVPMKVELSLDDLVRHFALSLSTHYNYSISDSTPASQPSELPIFRGVSQNEVRIFGGSLQQGIFTKKSYNPAPPELGLSTAARRGDYCLLHSDRVAVPLPGEAATASLEDILGHDHSLLQPSTMLKAEVLRNGLPLPSSYGLVLPLSLTKKVVVRAHAHVGEWKKIVVKMHSAGMCSFEEVGTVYENSVFGVLKKADFNGAHRLIFAGDVANHFFLAGCGAVELPNPDVLAQLQLQEGKKLYLASSDISQCYNRLRVPPWMRRYLGMPRVWSTEVGAAGPRRLLTPVLTVLTMSIIPAVRLCQAVTVSLVQRTSPARILGHLGPFEVSNEVLPLDIIYLDDLTTVGTNLVAVNERRVAVAETWKAHGLPEETMKAVVAVDGEDGEALGLLFRQSGRLSATPSFFLKLYSTTDALLEAKQCSPRHLSHVVGCWVYACLLRRPMLSVLSAVYEFGNEESYEESSPLPDAVLRELSMLLDLATAMCCSLSAPVSGRVYATDASTSGSGVTYLDDVTPIERSLLCESRVRKNWQTTLRTLSMGASEAVGPLQVSTAFTDFFERRPFTVAIAGKWKQKVHINALELEALLLAVRHARRSPVTTSHRVYFGLDSTVALGVAGKGRSSSNSLNRVARKLCAHLLWGGIQAEFFWIPTKWMPADEPSRRAR